MADLFGIPTYHKKVSDAWTFKDDLLSFITECEGRYTAGRRTDKNEGEAPDATDQITFDCTIVRNPDVPSYGFLSLDNPAVHQLKRTIEGAFADFMAEQKRGGNYRFVRTWSLRYGESSAQIPHTHFRGDWSGVYYVKLPKPTTYKDYFRYVNPLMGHPFMPEQHVVEVQEGDLIFFPAWLPHYCLGGSGERVIVSFDICGDDNVPESHNHRSG